MESTTAQRIKTAMEIRGMTQAELVEKTGINKGALSSYIAGRYKPKQTNTYLIANALHVSEGWLMGADVPMEPEKTSPLPASAAPAYGSYRIPIVATVAAGVPIYSENNIEGYVDYDKDPGNHVFSCHVKGHSMEPDIMDGDLIVVDQDARWDDMDIVVVTVDGNEGTCKRIQRIAEGVQLLSINKDFPPIFYSREEVEQLPVRVLGKVVEQRRKLH